MISITIRQYILPLHVNDVITFVSATKISNFQTNKLITFFKPTILFVPIIKQLYFAIQLKKEGGADKGHHLHVCSRFSVVQNKNKKKPNINKINVFISPKTLDRKCCQKHYIHITPYIDNEQHKFFKTLYSFIIYKIEKWGF